MSFQKTKLLQVEIDDRTDQELIDLTRVQERSRANLVRLLIHKAYEKEFSEKQSTQSAPAAS